MTAIAGYFARHDPSQRKYGRRAPDDGKIVIGNRAGIARAPVASVSTRNWDPSRAPPAVTVELNNGAIVGPSTASFTWSNFHTDSSNNLLYTQYASDWSTSISQSHPIGRSYNLGGVHGSRGRSGEHGAARVRRKFEQRVASSIFITVPKDPDMITAFGGLHGPIPFRQSRPTAASP